MKLIGLPALNTLCMKVFGRELRYRKSRNGWMKLKKKLNGITKYLKQNNMKTKLEVGKEYWLSAQKISRGIYLGESNSGNFDFRITLGSKHTKPLGELDVMTSNLSVYSEYIPEKQWQFTTPIAMKCTEEQFNGIKDRLAEMGYKLSAITFCSENRYLSNFIGGANNVITDLVKHRACDRNRTVFESFNPDLFLALAAMTDKEDGIKGEWWRYTDDMNDPIVPQKRLGEFVVPNKAWRKATAQEIIEHFEKKEFVLPEKWCVKVLTKEQDDAVVAYFNNKYNTGISDFLSCTGWWYYNYAPFVSDGSRKKPDCTEIAFDQFKKYVLKETQQSCPNYYFSTNIITYSHDSNIGFLFARRTLPNYLSVTIRMSSTPTETKTIIPIPPTKQATLFDDRVEITDWRPKEGEAVWVVSRLKNSFEYKKYIFDASIPFEDGEKVSPFIKRTESEAKQLVEKLNQAML